MSLTIVTDTDVAALPFSKEPQVSFRLDNDNKGPFAAILPLSHLLDPARERECTAQLAAQFAAIPATQMRDEFLNDSGIHYAVQAVFAEPHKHAVDAMATRMLEDALKTPPPAHVKNYAERLSTQILMHGNTAQGIIKGFAKSRGVPESIAATKLLESESLMNRPVGDEIRAEQLRYFALPETQRTMQAQQTEALKSLLAPLGETASAAILKATHAGDAQNHVQQMADALVASLKTAAPKAKESLLENLIMAATTQKIAPRKDSISDIGNSMLHGRGMRYTIEQLAAGRDFAEDPQNAARKAYAQMKQQAAGHRPEAEVKTIAASVEKAFADCPGYIRKAAEDMALKVVVVEDKVNINDIIPNNGGLMILSTMMGGSTGQGVYIKRQMLQNPLVLKEELLHEVERRAVHTDRGDVESFSLQLPWQKAIALDTALITNNHAREYLLKKPIVMEAGGGIKSNNAIGGHAKPLEVGQKNLVPFVEAVPDLYHYADMAKKEIAKSGSIRIGGKFGFGGLKYTNANALMSAAFPNAWPMLEGPQNGGKLTQDDTGRIEEITRTTPASTGFKKVASLRECCEGEIVQAHDMAASKSASAPFTQRTDLLAKIPMGISA